MRRDCEIQERARLPWWWWWGKKEGRRNNIFAFVVESGNESKEKKGENEVHTFFLYVESCRIPTTRFELNPARGTTAIALKQIQILCEKQAGT